MMELADRINSFAFLGEFLRNYPGTDGQPAMSMLRLAAIQSSHENPWFTPENITLALNNLGKMLTVSNLEEWIQPYADRINRRSAPKTIGIVTAGNIPLVGFHDFMCILLSGNKILAKLSSSDALLLPVLAEMLINHHPDWKDLIIFTKGKLEKFDAVIATGNNNTAKYFEYYFGKFPHIIRHNRNSIGIIHGNESVEVLEKLADDIMSYFGLGCRSISKLYVPVDYDFTPLVSALAKYSAVARHHKYCNNYDYNKSVFLLNQIPALDTGFLLLSENHELASRISVLHYSYYQEIGEINDELKDQSGNIQCVVSELPIGSISVMPGEAQRPKLGDYADNIDTMNFLLSMKG